MVLSAILFIALLVLFWIWKRNNLHLLEILAITLFVATINMNLMDITEANLELIKITKQMQMFWASILLLDLLIPVLIALFIDCYSVLSPSAKILLMIAWTVLLAIIEQAESWVGIVTFTGWHAWWSLVKWLCIILTAICCRAYLYFLLREEKQG